MRASWGDPADCGVLFALCITLAPLGMWARPGEGCGCGDEIICRLRPEEVREGIWRIARLLGEGRAGGCCGTGVPAGESDGDSSELMSMVMFG